MCVWQELEAESCSQAAAGSEEGTQSEGCAASDSVEAAGTRRKVESVVASVLTQKINEAVALVDAYPKPLTPFLDYYNPDAVIIAEQRLGEAKAALAAAQKEKVGVAKAEADLANAKARVKQVSHAVAKAAKEFNGVVSYHACTKSGKALLDSDAVKRPNPDKVLHEQCAHVHWQGTVMVPRTPTLAVVLRFGLTEAPKLVDLQKMVGTMAGEGRIPGLEPASLAPADGAKPATK